MISISAGLCAVMGLAPVVPPALVQIIPEQADLAFRVRVDAVAPGAESIWHELLPGLEARPSVARELESRVDGALGWLRDVERLTGVTLWGNKKEVWVTGWSDSDASGGHVYAVTVHGSAPAVPASLPDGVEELVLEERKVWVSRKGGLAWTVERGTLVLGTQRGLQRQFRRGRSSGAPKSALVREAARIRDRGHIQVAFSLTPEQRRDVAKSLGDLAVLLGFAESGHLSIDDKRAVLRLTARNKKEHRAVQAGAKSMVAYGRAVEALLEGSGELIGGFGAMGRRPKALPAHIDSALFETFLDDWLRKFELDALVRARSGYVTEVMVTLGSAEAIRGVLALAAFTYAYVQESVPSARSHEADVSRVLLALRDAQRLHQKLNGRYVKCAAVPATVPRASVRWPSGSCFDRLAFRPPSPVTYQLEASLEDNRLVLIARSDPDGDGVPQVWMLDEESDEVRTFGGSPSETSQPAGRAPLSPGEGPTASD